MALLGALIVLAIAVSSGILRATDAALMEFTREHIPRRLKHLSTLVDKALRTDVQMLVMSVACLAVGRRERHRASLGWLVPLAMMAAMLPVELFLKRVVPQPPPGGGAPAPLEALPWSMPPYAFPSGAMARTTMLLGWLGLRCSLGTGNWLWLWPPVLGVACVALNLVFAVSHWPTDVVGGVLLGAAGLSLAAALSPTTVLGAHRARDGTRSVRPKERRGV